MGDEHTVWCRRALQGCARCTERPWDLVVWSFNGLSLWVGLQGFESPTSKQKAHPKPTVYIPGPNSSQLLCEPQEGPTNTAVPSV